VPSRLVDLRPEVPCEQLTPEALGRKQEALAALWLTMLIVGALCLRPLVTLTLSPLCEEYNEARNAPDYSDKL